MTAPPIRAQDGMLRVGKQEIPLLSGEIQFWRMNPDAWRPALASARRAGFTMVATYLSWRRHEPTPGGFEWGARDPRLNARAFVRACAEEGLAVHLKPGPWICAEEPGGGYPDWLLADGELAALDGWGRPVIGYNPPFLHRVPCYRHPAYRSAARNWLAAVWDELGDLRHPDGPIVAVQLDNEPSHCFSHALYYADHHPLQAAAFRTWLGARYDDDAALREAWAAPATIAGAEPPRPGDLPGVLTASGGVNQWLADWAGFCGETITDHLRFLQQQHAELGAGELLPTVNLINPPVFETPLAHGAVRTQTGAATGVDHYYVPPLDLTDIDRLAKTAAFARLAEEPLVWAPELMAGIWRSPGEEVGYPDPTATEQAVWWGAALALGYQGFNLYMLANRENWEYAPIDDADDSIAFLDAARRLAGLIRQNPDLLRARPVSQVALGWHPPDAVAAWCVTGTARGGVAVHDEPIARRGYDSWAETAFDLLRAGVSYHLVDTSAPGGPIGGPALLLVPAWSSADDDRLTGLGWRVRRLAPGERIDDLAAAAVLRPAVELPEADRCLAAVTRSEAATYLHLVNWGAEREVSVLSAAWPSTGWVDLTAEQIHLQTGHSSTSRAPVGDLEADPPTAGSAGAEPPDLDGFRLRPGHTVLAMYGNDRTRREMA